jgi:hypothetical protein
MTPLCVLPCALFVVLASSFSGDLQSLRYSDHHPIRTGDEQERLVAASSMMTRSCPPQLGEQLPRELLRETAET